MTVRQWLDCRLSRVTSSGEYIAEIDGLRCLAIIPVVILHIAYDVVFMRMGAAPDWEALAKVDSSLRLVPIAGQGVQLFFVLSGFVLARPLALYWLGLKDTPPVLANYYLRRVTRIEPPYLLALTVYFLLLGQGTWPSFLTGLVYMHGFVFKSMNPINVAFWSLEVEVVFYLSAPLLAQIFRVRPAWLRRAILLLATAGISYYVRTQIRPEYFYLTYTFPGCIQFFLAGMLLADLYVSGAIRRLQSYAWDVVAVGVFLLIPYLFLLRNWTLVSTLPLLLVLLCAAVFQGRLVNRLSRLLPVTIIGTMCYSVYLWHNAVIHFLAPVMLPLFVHLLPSNGTAVAAASLICLPFILTACAAIYYFTEKPFMNGPGSRFLERYLRPGMEKSNRSPLS